jgi:molecular chaperone GrpE
VPDAKQDNGKQEKVANPKESAQQKEEAKQAVPQENKDKDMKEQLLRLAAEFDNYKKRTKNDVDNAKSAGKAELAKGFLPILDEFELAMIVVNKASDKTVARGIEMLYSNFTDMLKKEGLEEVSCKGVFDPYRHEIMMTRESKEKEGTILDVVKKGYLFDKVLLRPASVIVAKAPAVAASADTDRNDTKTK